MSPRTSLVLLWFSQVARFMADYGLRIFAVLQLAQTAGATRDAAFSLVTAIFMGPAVLLAPVVGAIGNSLPRHKVLVVAAAWSSAVMLVFGVLNEYWLLCVGLAAGGAAIYNPTRYALLPAAAQETGWPLPRIMGAMETGAILAMALGMILAGGLFFAALPPGPDAAGWGSNWPISPGMLAVFGCSVFCTLTVAQVRFRSDTERRESPWLAIVGFFTDCARLWAHPPTRFTLMGVALLRALTTAAGGALITVALGTDESISQSAFSTLVYIALLIGLGNGVGAMVGGFLTWTSFPLRWVPLGFLGLTLSLAYTAIMAAQPSLPLADLIPLPLMLAIGAFGGFANVPLLAVFQAETPADARGNANAVLNTAGYAAMAVLTGGIAALAGRGLLPGPSQLWLGAGLSLLLTAWAWWCTAQQLLAPRPA